MILTSLKLILNFLMINIAINNIFVNIIPSIPRDTIQSQLIFISPATPDDMVMLAISLCSECNNESLEVLSGQEAHTQLLSSRKYFIIFYNILDELNFILPARWEWRSGEKLKLKYEQLDWNFHDLHRNYPTLCRMPVLASNKSFTASIFWLQHTTCSRR